MRAEVPSSLSFPMLGGAFLFDSGADMSELMNKAKAHKRATCLMMFLLYLGIPTAVVTAAMGGPKIFLFLVEASASVDGTNMGCKSGENYRYSYLVDQKLYEFSSTVPVPCKTAIAPGKQVKIYYLPSNPTVSWSGSNPRDEICLILVGVVLLAAFASGWSYFWLSR